MNINFRPLIAAAIMGLVAGPLIIISVTYLGIDHFFIEDKFESKELIQPETKLTTDGKSIDTVYIYRFK